MNNLISHSYLILLLPLLSFIINGLFLCFRHRKMAAILSTSLSFLGAVFATIISVNFSFQAPNRFLHLITNFYHLPEH